MLDKIQGALFGVAIGDALGATTEFMSKEEVIEEYGKVTEIIGGGVWGLKYGETTDDTAMTLAVVKGIMSNSNNPIEEIGKQFRHWENTDPIDIGISTRATFENYEDDWFHAAEKAHHQQGGLSAGNGTLMRCLPVSLAYSDLKKIDELSELQSKMTHFDDLAAEACVIYNRIAKRLLENENLHTAIHTEIKNTRYKSNYVEEPDCPPDGYVVHTMKWVLYWLLNCDSFEDVVVGATNMGGDSDTIAAIAGGLKGLEVGFKQLPLRYANTILIKKDLLDCAEKLNEIRNRDITK
ncbi:ADP-ribosylglycohydrolase family protein [Lysinibacillus sp. BW-2-10]|uniref:ADP-ribosylglycohydrolase family protein n=1 Tax=Lysinibacillus sp. BW-2-10 TaxID=2590030 RepID=UPI00117E31B6|nr:ADP-ribosylglycohydrolase family protein [Lysinibacillus sp. BW-2-10]TSI05296.1 ADP-ribosyl-[dinitrogen reductase] hydrolase [Lysinibacillus sp. BW-2-10]